MDGMFDARSAAFEAMKRYYERLARRQPIERQLDWGTGLIDVVRAAEPSLANGGGPI